jgi:hypothetical protein
MIDWKRVEERPLCRYGCKMKKKRGIERRLVLGSERHNGGRSGPPIPLMYIKTKDLKNLHLVNFRFKRTGISVVKRTHKVVRHEKTKTRVR